MDIIVTTPRPEMKNAAKEAADVQAAGGGYYFRALSGCPQGLHPGDSRVYYVENGFIRGYAVLHHVEDGAGKTLACDTTGRVWNGGEGVFVWMDARSWTWVSPSPMRGFQGFRYFERRSELREMGGWQDPRPETTPNPRPEATPCTA